MKPQLSEEEILAMRLYAIHTFLPATKRADIYFRHGTYFWCYPRGEHGIVIGCGDKKHIFQKEVSDTNGKELRRAFNRKYSDRRRKKAGVVKIQEAPKWPRGEGEYEEVKYKLAYGDRDTCPWSEFYENEYNFQLGIWASRLE